MSSFGYSNRTKGLKCLITISESNTTNLGLTLCMRTINFVSEIKFEGIGSTKMPLKCENLCV
jgi:hypothetical protein